MAGRIPIASLIADTSDEPRPVTENGRQYWPLRGGLYHFPHDEADIERMDIYSDLFYEPSCMGFPLHGYLETDREHRPPRRVIDVGVGSANWANWMAMRYPHAEIHGLDIARCQTYKNVRQPANLFLHVPCDYETYWPAHLQQGNCDLVHMQRLDGSVSNWFALYRKAFTSLRPGGYLQQIEIDIRPRCGDGSMAPDSQFLSWYNDMRRALAQIGMSIDMDPEQRLETMRLAGFGDASRERVEIGLADPELIAPHNERQRTVVAQYKLLLDLSEGLEAMCTALFSRVLGMPLDHIRAYCQKARQEAFNSNAKVYHNVYIWLARRPS